MRTQNPFNENDQTTQRLVRLENSMRNLNSGLAPVFLKGRLRTDRTAPANSADIQTPDQLYDWVLKADYAYVVINDAGALAWRRIIMGAF